MLLYLHKNLQIKNWIRDGTERNRLRTGLEMEQSVTDSRFFKVIFLVFLNCFLTKIRPFI